jgi:hypothetical protein
MPGLVPGMFVLASSLVVPVQTPTGLSEGAGLRPDEDELKMKGSQARQH